MGARANAKFHLKDERQSYGQKGLTKIVKNVLFFSLQKAPMGEPTAPWSDIDVRAEEIHAKQYPREFNEFKSAHPDYVIPWSE